MSEGFVKVCGITRRADALHAVQSGATALGFVFWPRSPRAIDLNRAADVIAALPAGVMTFGVFVNEPVEGILKAIDTTGIQAVQLHGEETAHFADRIERPILKSVAPGDALEASRAWPARTTLLLEVFDPVRRGGTGTIVDWVRASEIARQCRIVLAGGLTPTNVEEAIRTVCPFGVDVSSGVEESPGIKDVEKVALFVANARRAFARLRTR